MTQADFDREVAREPEAARTRYATPAGRKQLLDAMIRFEVMSQAAEARGYLQDPEIVRHTRQQAINKLIEKEVGDKTGPESISDADVKRYYDEHRDKDFSLPPAFHVRHIQVADEDTAVRLATRARGLRRDDDKGFIALVEAHSTDALTRNAGGDLGFVDASSPYPKELVAAIAQLNEPGDVGGPIKTERGFHVVRLLVKRAAVVRSLDDSRDVIRQRIQRDRRHTELEALITRLSQDAHVQVTDGQGKAAANAL